MYPELGSRETHIPEMPTGTEKKNLFSLTKGQGKRQSSRMELFNSTHPTPAKHHAERHVPPFAMFGGQEGSLDIPWLVADNALLPHQGGINRG